jgi:hypothetical protein
MLEYKASDTTHDDDKRLGWNHALVWKQPLQGGRQADTNDAADCRAGSDEDIEEAHEVFVCDA